MGSFPRADRGRDEHRTTHATTERILSSRECPPGGRCLIPSWLHGFEEPQAHVATEGPAQFKWRIDRVIEDATETVATYATRDGAVAWLKANGCEHPADEEDC